MLVACWSPKGGSGTTVVACSLAALLARTAPPGTGVVLADLAGDVPAVVGIPTAGGPGLAQWLSAGPDVGVGALARLEVEVGAGLRLLPWGRPAPGLEASVAGRVEALAAALADDPRAVVADCGSAAGGAGLALAAGAALSLLVLRPCYLALQRALAAPLRPSGVVLVKEPGRAVGRRDVEDVLGVPVRAEVEVDPSVSRAVDAGLQLRRLPRALERALRPALAPPAWPDAA
jgi:MinD-like ATPase involved in chromosome partitioning or flagellar assembly